MESVDWVVFFLALLAVVGLAVYRFARAKVSVPPTPEAVADDSAYRVSYAPPEFEWSGTSSATLPLKILTYKQYECLEDARYGFRIVGLPPAERKQPQPYKTRAHGLKTVASLVKHGFLREDGDNTCVITDHGLNALEVCGVRY